jgi:hypothetical protein
MRVLLLLFAVAATSCLVAGDPPTRNPGSGKPVGLAAPDGETAPDGWCHIRGRVVYDGNPIPVRKLIPKSKGAYTEDWVVNPTNRGVQNVVVWLVPELTAEQLDRLKSRKLRDAPSFPAKQVYHGLMAKEDVTVAVPEKPIAFFPHVVGVRAGSDIVIRNNSTRPESVRWTSINNGEFSPLVPPNVGVFRVEDAKKERNSIAVESVIHPWMKAFVWVFDHPYFAVTNADGEFEIRFAPKGSLRLTTWQEDVGFKGGRDGRWGEPIQVPSGKLDLGDIKLKPR